MNNDSSEENQAVQQFWTASGFEKVETDLKKLRQELNAADFINPGDVQEVWEERNKLRDHLGGLVNKHEVSKLAIKAGLISKFGRTYSDAGFLIDRVKVLKVMMDDLLELERFRGHIEKRVSTGKRQMTVVTFNMMGIIGTAIFASAAFITNCIWLWRCNNSASDDSSDLFCSTDGLVWGSMGLHPFLMSAAFLLCVPAAACSYKVIRGVCGASHTAAMIVHVLLNLTAAALAWGGVTTAWISHESDDIPHFHSSHSLLGGLLLSIFAAHIVTSLFVFTCGSKELRASFHILHMAVGQAVTLGGMFVASIGILYFETESYSNDWDEFGENGYWRPVMTVTQYCIICAMLSMVLLFYGKVLLKKT